ncbi:MAG TPA: CAP domain-containing protein [Polyangiaceae bacterium]|nr:CAP domain-containing protein [Polyangiaceae bacterium]
MPNPLRRSALCFGIVVSVSVLGAARPTGSAARPTKAPKTPVGTGAPRRLSYEEAQLFVLSLINRDRAKAKLRPVQMDDAASRAGQRHARDLATHGFTGHVGSDGSVPEQRYTESGGQHFVQENAACISDTTLRQLAPNALYDSSKLAALHQMFMSEMPPNDGHRRNILNPSHNYVGIGLALPADLPQPCLTQEFVDQYGHYEALPSAAKRSAKFRVAGTVSEPLLFGGVGLGKTPLPVPPPKRHLNGNLYRIPAPDKMFFPAGFKTPKPVSVDGPRFDINLDLGKNAGPGLYAISIWAKQPGTTRLFMISMRTIRVE